MARWAGWGAGPAGAGAAGGPSRLFLGGAMVLAAVMAVVFAMQARLAYASNALRSESEK